MSCTFASNLRPWPTAGSLNIEAIACLEAVLLPWRATAEEVIARARAIREALPKGKFSAKDINAFKREGRP